MEEIQETIYNAFKRGDYNKCLEIINNHVDKGYGIDSFILYYYIRCLIKNREYDKAYELTKWMERTGNGSESLNIYLYQLYFFCYKSNDAERIAKKLDPSIVNNNILLRIYLLEGKIEEAKDILDKIPEEEQYDALKRLRTKIDNHEKLNAFIEIDYDAFKKQGNELETGHIVYLKQRPESIETIEIDEKSARRPYMVWKAQDKKLYLFPVTTRDKKGCYKLYAQNYPNSIGDRIVKDVLCTTSSDNVLSVCDKVQENDLRILLKSIYERSYMSHSKKEREINADFMKEYHTDISENDIIVVYDRNTHEKTYKFVCRINDDSYDVLDIREDLRISSEEVERFKKDRYILKVIKPSEEEIEEIRKNIPLHLRYKSFEGARIKTNGPKYIVIDEDEDECICIFDVYSPSYINIERIKKSQIKEVIEFLDEEDIQKLKEMISRNASEQSKALIKGEKRKKK